MCENFFCIANKHAQAIKSDFLLNLSKQSTKMIVKEVETMKNYTFKLAISFVIIYVLLMAIVIFSFVSISTNFINRQAQKNIESYTVVYANQLSLKLNQQLEMYQITMRTIISSSDHSDHVLEQARLVFDAAFIGFGKIELNGLVTDERYFNYSDDFEPVDYQQPISLYSFMDAFLDPNDTPYLFFYEQGYLGWMDAKTFIDQALIESNQHEHFLVMYEDNLIGYKSFDHSLRFFYDYIDSTRGDLIETIKEQILRSETGSLRRSFLGLDSIIVFSPLSNTLSSKQLYLVMTFDANQVISSMQYLTNMLWGLFLAIFILFSIGLLLLFKVLETKINDIEMSRLTHYYVKPYIMMIRPNGKIISYNRSLKDLLGDYDVYDHVKDLKIISEDNLQILEEIIKRQKAFTALFNIGLTKPIYLRFIPIKVFRGYYLIGDDVSMIEGRFDEFRDLALFSGVTKLPNRNSLFYDLEAFFKDKERLLKVNSCLVIDITSFEKIRLLLGELTSERFLNVVADIIHRSLDTFDARFYHISTDQFAVFFNQLNHYKQVNEWTEHILETFNAPLFFERNLLNIDLKIGIFHIDTKRYEILNPDTVYNNMLLALNHAKGSALFKEFEYDVSLSVIASREQKMELDLAEAVLVNEFYMVLQPQYSNKDEKIIGFEALIRWKNPKYVNESPLKFIQMAEKNNLILDIGRIALHETFSIAKRLEPYNIKISVNISPVQLLQAGFVTEIIAIFEQYELKKHSITLEITETFLITSFELVINKLKLLQAYGFDIHLDDFGTGYSSLQYLRDLPIDAIKIDRAFIINLESDSYSRAIVTMITNLARNIGIEVISEGVEDLRQNAILTRIGCQVIQGYLISPAVTEDLAVKILEDYNVQKIKKLEQPKPKKGKEGKT